jgi:hypothetical protein
MCVPTITQPKVLTTHTKVHRSLIHRSLIGIAFLFVCITSVQLPTLAHAQGCANEEIRVLQRYALKLPDCRAYEQVSPVGKNFGDASGRPFFVQSSSNGTGVTYYSLVPFPGVASPGEFVTYLSMRSGAGWSTQGLVPQASAGGGLHFTSIVGMTEDLSYTLLFDYPSVPPSAVNEATPGIFNYYIRNSATGVYRLFDAAPGFGESYFADASADDRKILFESFEHFKNVLPNVTNGRDNLYLWEEGRVKLVGVLPGGEAPSGGSVAGPGGPLIEEELGAGEVGGAKNAFYTQDTISEDGSRIIFTDIGTGRVYVREPEAEKTIPVSEGSAYWRAATPDGRYVLYTEGGTLYRFDVSNETREGLGSANGVLGISKDGLYVYFVNGPHLLEWHNGNTTLIAGLNVNDASDWSTHHGTSSEGAADGARSSDITPDGKAVLFASGQLNGLDELYLYDATKPVSTENPICVSCRPGGTATTHEAYLTHNIEGTFLPVSRDPFVTRNLSADGDRVFFQTEEALVPGDSNGQMDVYEWEQKGAPDSDCPAWSGNAGDGCLYLVSTGQSGDQSYFGDASVDGSNVFFFTRQSLVEQDQDNNVDVYDASVGGGLTSQNQVGPSTSCTAEACRGVPSVPALDEPSTLLLSGSGNLMPAEAKPKPKHKQKKKTGRRRKGSRSRRGSRLTRVGTGGMRRQS